MKKIICAFLAFLLLSSCALAASYPKKKLSGIVQWGAGGGTDTLMRPLCSLAEEILGQKIVVKNMAGGSGSIGAQYVYDAKADGYTLLLGAENPVLYKALEISDITYDDFECVLLIGDESVGIAVNKDAGIDTLEELISLALEKPGEITCATTGVGGLPWQVASLIYYVTGASFNQIPYDSDATARAAVISGECVFTACKLQSGLETWKSGDLKYLCLLTSEESDVMPGVRAITEIYPEFEALLPWGPFYGVFVKKGTDEGIVTELSRAFSLAFEDESYKMLLNNLCVNPLGLTGQAARDYIDRWGETTLGALKTAGAVQ